jgi:hypothetical protein
MAMLFFLVGFQGIFGEEGNGCLGIREVPDGAVTQGCGEQLVIPERAESKVCGPGLHATLD